MCLISIIIPVRDRWDHLSKCLDSIGHVRTPSVCEIIVIDDGSTEKLPDGIRNRSMPYSLRFIRQIPLGIPAARNRGLFLAQGDTILFVDSDCTVDAHCLANLVQAVNSWPDDVAFQLRIVGHNSSHVGMVENLHLTAAQQSRLTENGYIRYINTSGFALRRSFIDQPEFFDLRASRGEDSLLLLKCAAIGRLPRYVPQAVAQHSPPLSLGAYIIKNFEAGYTAGPARRQLTKKPGILMTSSQRRDMFRRLWQITSDGLVPWRALPLELLRFVAEVIGRFSYCIFGVQCGRANILSVPVDSVTEEELQARVISSAERRKGMFVTYLTAWTLVQSQSRPSYRELLWASDLCYADGMGVVLALLCTKLRRIKKVTANSFFCSLFREIADRELRIALIGGSSGVAESVAMKIKKWRPCADVCLCESGYFSSQEEDRFLDTLVSKRPHIVFVGMGQPLQELHVCRWRKVLPNTVFYCVGSLFDLISGGVKGPPRWIRTCGLEWFYRLVHSPKQLWQRYVLGLPLLAFYIIRDILQKFILIRDKHEEVQSSDIWQW